MRPDTIAIEDGIEPLSLHTNVEAVVDCWLAVAGWLLVEFVVGAVGWLSLLG